MSSILPSIHEELITNASKLSEEEKNDLLGIVNQALIFFMEKKKTIKQQGVDSKAEKIAALSDIINIISTFQQPTKDTTINLNNLEIFASALGKIDPKKLGAGTVINSESAKEYKKLVKTIQKNIILIKTRINSAKTPYKAFIEEMNKLPAMIDQMRDKARGATGNAQMKYNKKAAALEKLRNAYSIVNNQSMEGITNINTIIATTLAEFTTAGSKPGMFSMSTGKALRLLQNIGKATKEYSDQLQDLTATKATIEKSR